MKLKFKHLKRYNEAVQQLISRRPDVLNTKLGYAFKKFEEMNIAKPFREHNNEIVQVRIDHALTDKKTGAILRDTDPKNQRGFLYDKENTKAVFFAEQELENKWEEKEFEIEPYICKTENIPFELNKEELESFQGLVI